jgi:hypothetical protein
MVTASVRIRSDCHTAGLDSARNDVRCEVIARLVRMTGGNLRLLTRLLTQVERVLGVNDTQTISVEIVEAARDSLVIGQA